MALQVWLPLNDSLNNQGLGNMPTLSLSPLTFDDNGKIGKCLKIPKITTNNVVISELQGVKKFSFSCWLYLDTNLTNSSYTRIFSLGHTSDGENGYIRIETIPTNGEFQIIYNKSASHGGGGYATVTYYGITGGSTTSAKNKWVHVTVTNDGTNVRTYFNGELKGTWAVNTIYDTGSLNGNFYLGGSYVNLNDVRIYDHCLSPKEAKEIAKGLCVHYPFNDAYIESTTNIITSSKYYSSNGVGWGGHNAVITDYDCTNEPVPFNVGSKAVVTYDPNADSVGGFGVGTANGEVAVLPNTTYCYSAYVKASDDFAYFAANHLYRYERENTTTIAEGGIATKSKMIDVGNGWYRIWNTFTTNANTTKVSFMFFSYPRSNVTYWFGGAQVEQKDHLTPYTSSSRSDTTIYDCSGFNNNGTVVLNPVIVGDSPRYDKCCSFTDNKKVYVSGLPTNGLSNSYTFSWWAKSSTYSSKMCWGFSNGNRLNFYDGLYHNTGDGASNPYKKPNTSTNIDRPDSNWHHFVITGNGTQSLLYMDGNICGQATTYKSITGDTIYFNGWDSSNNYNFNGKMSDFRIYSTALSADSVKELYNAPTHITKTGTLMTQGEVIE